MSDLRNLLGEVVAKEVNRRVNAHFKASNLYNTEAGKAFLQTINSKEIAKDAVVGIVELLECYLYLPCCHVTGMHDPEHYRDGKYICDGQKAGAFERFCTDLGVNPVVRMKPGCFWCTEHPEYRRGEGIKLFKPEEPVEESES